MFTDRIVKSAMVKDFIGKITNKNLVRNAAGPWEFAKNALEMELNQMVRFANANIMKENDL